MLKLKEESLDWALAHTLRYGDTGIFPIPFEYIALKFNWDNVKQRLLDLNILDWIVRPHRSLLAPKARYGFRVITQLDPLDFIIFASIIKEIGIDIENKRVPISNDVVFSYRFETDSQGKIFNTSIGYRNFQNKTTEILKSDHSIKFVAIADIADFYPRIYHHRLENALQSATKHSAHLNGLKLLISGWNGTETYGIPVGSAPVRLLAEITISDIDQSLLANGINFIRYNDDYRIFANTHSDGYRYISYLAEILYKNHGLSLQPQKTSVLYRDIFQERFLQSPEDKELDSLKHKFDELVQELKLGYDYEGIEYDSLDDKQKALIDSLNLAELFRDELKLGQPIDLSTIRFILRRLGQLSDESVVDDALANLDQLYPVFPEIINYISRLGLIQPAECHGIGKAVIKIFRDSIISESEYHKMWALDLFARSTKWDCGDEFLKLYSTAVDLFTKRKLILAMGKASQTHWFQSQWRNLFDHPHWPRRALIYGASCLTNDARKHWYNSIESSLDLLELSVMKWARQNPINN